jgi:hypothetical protein
MSNIDPEAGREAADAVEPGLDLLAVPRAAVREPVVLILLLAGFFDGISGNPLHAMVLGAAAIALSADAARERSMITPAGRGFAIDLAYLRRKSLWPVFAVAVLGYAAVAGGFERYSWPGTIAVVVPASVVLLVSWRGPLPGAPTPVRPYVRGSVLWAAVFITLGLWELTMLLMQPTLKTDSWPHPTLSTLMDPVLVSHPGRTISMCVWAALGWFLVRR